MSEDFVPPPFGKAELGRGLTIRMQVAAKSTSAGWAAKDISAARWKYFLRARSATAAYVIGSASGVELTKHATAATDGWLDHWQDLGAAATDVLTWEITEIDNDTSAANTPSLKVERVLVRWKQAIEALP